MEEHPYGKPQYNQKAYILNPCLQPAPIGVAGELYLGGTGLARGYFNRPDQTVERFLPNPFSEEPGERIYRTGDLARYRPDGNIELIGRVDFQVKIRGLRIECGEIESTLRKHPGVREAVVAAKDFGGGDKRLVAFIRPNPQTALPVCQLLKFKKQGLPPGWQHHELPNGLVMVHQNKPELEFSYREIFERDNYLQHGISLQDGACIFDVGANVGMFAIHAGQNCKDARIHCFEPIPALFEALKINTGLYGLNAKLFNCGLSKDAGNQVFTFYPHLSLMSGRFADHAGDRATVKSFLAKDLQVALNDQRLDELLAERMTSEQVTCEMKSLSQVFRENNTEYVDLLKIDVEKSELDVMAGIELEDWNKIGQLVMEVYDTGGKTGTGHRAVAPEGLQRGC